MTSSMNVHPGSGSAGRALVLQLVVRDRRVETILRLATASTIMYMRNLRRLARE